MLRHPQTAHWPTQPERTSTSSAHSWLGCGARGAWCNIFGKGNITHINKFMKYIMIGIATPWLSIRQPKTTNSFFLTIYGCSTACTAWINRETDFLKLSTAQKLLAGWVQLCRATKPSCGEVLLRLEILLSVFFFIGKLRSPPGFPFFCTECGLTEQKFQIQIR